MIPPTGTLLIAISDTCLFGDKSRIIVAKKGEYVIFIAPKKENTSFDYMSAKVVNKDGMIFCTSTTIWRDWKQV